MKPLKLLIVEDVEADALLLVSELSRSFDVSYHRVDTLPELEAALAREQWDLVITDFSLPQLNAMRVLSLLRERQEDLPCITISGTIDEEFASEALRAGARDFISKDRWTRLVPAVLRELREKEERRRKLAAERALVEARQRMRFALETANVGTWEIDRAAGCCTWSAEFGRVHGLPAEPYAGSLDALIEAIHPDDRLRAREALLRAMEATEEFRLEYRVAGDVQPPRWVTLIGRPVRGEGATAAGAAGVSIDITGQKALEDQFRHAQRMESIGVLAGGVAHDFNNLLTAILGFSNLLLEEPYIRKAPARVREDIDQIRQAGQRAATLTSQLLAFSRKQVRQPAVIDLNPVISNLEPMLKRLVGVNIRIVTRLSRGLRRVFADAGQIEQVIMNLVVNARDAMPAGGEVTIATENVALNAQEAASRMGLKPGPHVMLSVRDTGTGMSAETRAHLFEPFFTTKPPGRGTGLGLATIFGIVTQHEGHIEVESELGQGTTFRIYLPEARQKAAVAVEQLTGRRAARGETLLVVDDEQPVRQLARQVLAQAGYRVLDAGSADEAEKLAANHQGAIHLLVTDIVMPGTSGRTLAHRLLAARPDMKVLYISGYAEGGVPHHGALGEGVAFLQKPFTPATLMTAVREALDTEVTYGEGPGRRR